jgi:hypothetical protein
MAMIDTVDEQLLEWLKSEVPGSPVSLAPPTAGLEAKPAVSCYLLELAAAPPARAPANGRPVPLQLGLDLYLEAHRLLGNLVLAAMDRPGCEVDLTPPPAAMWQALGAIPRPAFVMQLPLRRERPLPSTGIVRHPIVIREASLRALSGRVLGPGEVPLAGARLEIPALHLSTRSDATGRFTFPPIPSSPLPSEVIVTARGRMLRVVPDQLIDGERQLIITFPITEN